MVTFKWLFFVVYGMIKKIGVLKGPGIGDIATSMPLLRNLRNSFPKAEITVFHEVSYGAGRKLLDCPYVDRIIEINQKNSASQWLKKIGEIRKERLDIIIDSFPSTAKTALFCFLSGAAAKYGYATNPLSFLYTVTVDPGQKTSVEIGNDILRKLGIEPDNKGLELFIDIEPSKPIVEKFLAGSRIKEDDFLIAIHAGRTQDAVRTWDDDRWAELCGMLMEKGSKVVFVGTGEDSKRTENIISRTEHKPANFVGPRRLEETAAMLKRSNLCITINGGVMHIAAALRRPLVALCGDTKPGWDPYGEKCVIVRKNPGIYRDTKDHKQGNNEYMLAITVEDVLDTIRNNLAKLKE